MLNQRAAAAARLAIVEASLVTFECELDLRPFYADADQEFSPTCACQKCLRASEAYDPEWEDMKREAREAEERREAEIELIAEIARWQPEPPVRLTGRKIAVEWEYWTGHRHWEIMDEGELDRAVWWAQCSGTMLSDVDEPAQ